jgi:NAD(P)H dehydrogenase (quinone)
VSKEKSFMKIGVFVHSQTGNTAKLGLTVAHALREKGHDVAIELLRPARKVNTGSKNIEFRNLPDAAGFDAVLFGGPIWGFNASPVITSALTQIAGLKGKKTLYFLTSFFPSPLSGCNRAQGKVRSLLEKSGASVLEGESLSWGFWCGKKRLESAAARICERIVNTAH